MSHADPIMPAIEAQAEALRAISTASGYLTDLGAAVLHPDTASGDRPAAGIMLSDDVGAESDLSRGTVVVRTEWIAWAVGEPVDLLPAALAAQTDMVVALRAVCGARITRGAVGRRADGSNYLVASVNVTQTVTEVE